MVSMQFFFDYYSIKNNDSRTRIELTDFYPQHILIKGFLNHCYLLLFFS